MLKNPQVCLELTRTLAILDAAKSEVRLCEIVLDEDTGKVRMVRLYSGLEGLADTYGELVSYSTDTPLCYVKNVTINGVYYMEEIEQEEYEANVESEEQVWEARF